MIHSTGSTPNLYLYSGEQFDPDLNLYYNRARYLNVSTGRFWTMDLLEGNSVDPPSLHKYTYASSDPVNRKDPQGLEDADLTSNLVSTTTLTILKVMAIVSAGVAVCYVDFELGRDDCLDHGTNRITLYHYTALPNLKEILDSGVLNPSLLGGGDAFYGEGQYLTDLSPSDASLATKGQVAYALYLDGRKWFNVDVAFLRFDLSQRSVQRVRSVYGSRFPNRGIYLHPSLFGLVLSGNMTGTGHVNFLPSPE